MNRPRIGLYEKAIDPEKSWQEKLAFAKNAGFDFIEMSIDESDKRIARLDWSKKQRQKLVNYYQINGLRIPSICLSAHRRFPFGSHDPMKRKKADEIMEKAIELAFDIGVRVVQLAGYDVYYEQSDDETLKYYLLGMRKALKIAQRYQVMLAIETMDHPFLNSIRKIIDIKHQLHSPWLAVYPDVGNLSAWGNDIEREFTLGAQDIVAVHLKDTLSVSSEHAGVFKGVPFKKGCVDFPLCFKILKSIDYSGPFLIEMWYETLSNPVKDIMEAKQWLCELMEQAGFGL